MFQKVDNSSAMPPFIKLFAVTKVLEAVCVIGFVLGYVFGSKYYLDYVRQTQELLSFSQKLINPIPLFISTVSCPPPPNSLLFKP